MILSADWSISRLQSWTCLSLPTVPEFVKLTQSIVVEAQRQSADLYKVQLCNRQFFVVSTAIYVVKVYECHPLGLTLLVKSNYERVAWVRARKARVFTACGPGARSRAPMGSRGKVPDGVQGVEPRKPMGYSTLKLPWKVFLYTHFWGPYYLWKALINDKNVIR